MLRTSNEITSQSAIAITHFPKTTTSSGEVLGSRTNALVLGYDIAEYDKLKMALNPGADFPASPSRLIMAFLEIESQKRFDQVRGSVRDMQTTIHNLALETESGRVQPTSRRKLNKTVELYFEVHHLKNDGLVSWRDQLQLLINCIPSGRDDVLLEYLQQLVARYDHRIGRCDMVLQGASLAYQMVSEPVLEPGEKARKLMVAKETTHLSRKDTEIAVGDGKTIKAIAVLTMVFLPGTFIAVRAFSA